MRFLRRSLIGLFLLSLAVGLLAYAGQSVIEALQTRAAEERSPRPARERIFPANVITYRSGTVTPVLTVFGEIRSRRTLDLRTKSAGTVVRLSESFEEGGRVDSGELLLQLDPSDAQAALDVASADLAEAEAELRDAVAGLALSSEDVAAAREQLTLREQALARQKSLKERGVGTEAAVETAALAETAASTRGEAADRFGRDFTGKPELSAPWYGVRVTGALFHTQGGLRVDAQARVLRESGVAFPNLFAGGGAARGVSGPSCWGYIAGNGLLTATTYGRLAGETAAALA